LKSFFTICPKVYFNQLKTDYQTITQKCTARFAKQQLTEHRTVTVKNSSRLCAT
jgi:hypothetical protein